MDEVRGEIDRLETERPWYEVLFEEFDRTGVLENFLRGERHGSGSVKALRDAARLRHLRAMKKRGDDVTSKLSILERSIEERSDEPGGYEEAYARSAKAVLIPLSEKMVKVHPEAVDDKVFLEYWVKEYVTNKTAETKLGATSSAQPSQ